MRYIHALRVQHDFFRHVMPLMPASVSHDADIMVPLPLLGQDEQTRFYITLSCDTTGATAVVK